MSYYVDSAQGDDSAAGTDSAHAWRSLARVNQTTFHAGDQVLLKAGGRWSGQLWPQGSGASGAPITLDRYGDGANPRIDGGGAVARHFFGRNPVRGPACRQALSAPHQWNAHGGKPRRRSAHDGGDARPVTAWVRLLEVTS